MSKAGAMALTAATFAAAGWQMWVRDGSSQRLPEMESED